MKQVLQPYEYQTLEITHWQPYVTEQHYILAAQVATEDLSRALVLSSITIHTQLLAICVLRCVLQFLI